MRFGEVFVSAGCVLMCGAAAASAGMISVPGGSGSSISFFEGNTDSSFNRSVGQTFTVPSPTEDNVLSRLTVQINAFSSLTDGHDYEVRLYEFDAATKTTVGGALFSSGQQTLAEPDEFTIVTVDLFPNLVLDAGKKYIAFITTQGVANDNDSRAGVFQTRGNMYDDGEFVVQFGTSLSPTYAKDAWQVDFSGDLAGFEAVFVPGPGVVSVGVLGAAGLMGRRRR